MVSFCMHNSVLSRAAEGLIDFDELRAKLEGLEADRKTAAREFEAVRSRAERLASLKLETEALIEAYSSKARGPRSLHAPGQVRRLQGAGTEGDR
jgi:hypothetical protein